MLKSNNSEYSCGIYQALFYSLLDVLTLSALKISYEVSTIIIPIL